MRPILPDPRRPTARRTAPPDWFGFNAGSALGAGGLTAAVFFNALAAGRTGLRFVEQKDRSATATPPHWALRPVPSQI
jgi:hypothetical protein